MSVQTNIDMSLDDNPTVILASLRKGDGTSVEKDAHFPGCF